MAGLRVAPLVLVFLLLAGCPAPEQAAPQPSPAPTVLAPRHVTKGATLRLSPTALVALAGGPQAASEVVYGRTGRLLALSTVRRPGATAWRLFDAKGRLVAQGARPTAWPDGWGALAAGPGFVLMHYSQPPVYLGPRGRTIPLKSVRDSAPPRVAEHWFGDGSVVDPAAGTIRQPRLAGCRRSGVVVDRLGRIWCLDRRAATVRWSDDGGRGWHEHELATPYDYWCEGGYQPSVRVDGSTISIGGWTIEFSLDRGESWRIVTPPAQVTTVPGARCPDVIGSTQGRLNVGYFDFYLADDSTNTTFHKSGTYYSIEGVLLRRQGARAVRTTFSYDAGESWRPFDVHEFMAHMPPS